MSIFGSVLAELAKDGTIIKVTCKCGNDVYCKKEDGNWKVYSDGECSVKHDFEKEKEDG